MNTITWKYARPLSREALVETQQKLGVVFPTAYSECVLQYNGGRPTPSTFDFSGRTGAVLHNLLPVGVNEKYGIVSTLEMLSDRLDPGYIPFAGDPFGNYLCFRYPVENEAQVYFWDHEAGAAPVLVCDGFASLLQRLY